MAKCSHDGHKSIWQPSTHIPQSLPKTVPKGFPGEGSELFPGQHGADACVGTHRWHRRSTHTHRRDIMRTHAQSLQLSIDMEWTNRDDAPANSDVNRKHANAHMQTHMGHVCVWQMDGLECESSGFICSSPAACRETWGKGKAKCSVWEREVSPC